MSNNDDEIEPLVMQSNIELMDVHPSSSSSSSSSVIIAATSDDPADDVANETSWNDDYDDYLDCVTENSPYRKLSPQRRFFLVGFIGIVMISAMLFGWEDVTVQEDLEQDETFQVKNNTIDNTYTGGGKTSSTASSSSSSSSSSSPSSSSSCTAGSTGNNIDYGKEVSTCSDLCTILQTKRKEKYNGRDLLNPSDVLQLARNGRKRMIQELKKDYGKYFDEIFIKNTASTDNNNNDDDDDPTFHGMHGYIPNGQSRDRLKQKLKLKVLKMMQAVRDSESNNIYGCNCFDTTTEEGKQQKLKTKNNNNAGDDGGGDCIPNFYEQYIFANGGHSNAAGHGNKFNESYTAYFTNDVKHVFEAIGIQVKGRNYAMGGMR